MWRTWTQGFQILSASVFSLESSGTDEGGRATGEQLFLVT